MTRAALNLVVFAALAVASPAAAAIVDLDFGFSATDFYVVRGGGSPPIGTIVGSIELSFDNSADIAPTNDGLTATGFNFPGGPLLYTYDKASDFLRFATTEDALLNRYDADFLSFYLQPSADPTSLVGVAYSLGGYSIFAARTVTVNDANAVPEPGAWALMLLGFGGLGAALRRQRRARYRSAAAH